MVSRAGIEDNQSDVMGKKLTFYSFLQRHPKDSGKGDSSVRWWPEWRELEWKNEDEYHYGKRILFSLRLKPDATKYGKFYTEINLQDENIVLAGLFNFAPPMGSAKSSVFIERNVWDEFVTKYEEHSIIGPVLSPGRKMAYMSASTMRGKLSKVISRDMRGVTSSWQFLQQGIS